MPLLDHFHSPLGDERSWEGFHGEWSGMIVQPLDDAVLPAGYFAEPRIHWGSRVEIDVATVGQGVAGVGRLGPPPEVRSLGARRLDPSHPIANLHEELLSHLRFDSSQHPFGVREGESIYAASYRGVPEGEGSLRLDLWEHPLDVGGPLPRLPLWLSEEICVPLDLETSDQATCRALRIDEE